MIKLVEASECDEVAKFCGGDPLGIKIASALIAYGTGYDFARFWRGEKDGRTTCVFSRIDGDMTCFFQLPHDMDEVKSFTEAVGFRSLTCDGSKAEIFSGNGIEYVNIMKYRGHQSIPLEIDGINFEPSLMDVWKIISETSEFEIDASSRDSWYADMSHRIRHSVSRAFMLDKSAVLYTLGETEYGSVISGVAVKKCMRGRGTGKKIVQCASEILSENRRDVFLMCTDELTEFYKKIGYFDYGRASVIYR